MTGRGQPAHGRTSVGELIAAALAAAGVRFAFTVPGESFLGLLDALPRAGIRVVATRHEGGAAFMAEAVGQLTGQPAAVLGTRAVGASNMAIGVHTARQNSTPLVALVGQVERAFRGREAFQEVDLVRTVGGLAKWAAEVDHPSVAGRLVGEGLKQMRSGRPGPVLFALPEDVLDELAEGSVADLELEPAPSPAPHTAAVRAVVDLLAGAERPLILAGGGVKAARATGGLVALAEALDVPVMAAWRRPDVFPNDHRLYLGMTGYGAPHTVLGRLEAADALLVLGCRLSEVATFGYRFPPAGGRWAHVDLAPREPTPGLTEPDVAVSADAGDFLAAALAATEGRRRPARALNAADRAGYLAASVVDEVRWDGPGVHPGRVVTNLQRLLPDDAVLTTDAGNFGLWPARGYRFTQPRTFLGPTSGAMGYGLPSAVAASLCQPKRTVLALAGDGGFAMTMNELETAVREGGRPVVLVFDNRRYGTIAMHQQREGRAQVGVELGPIDFVRVAEACGAVGRHVERDDDLEPALAEALSARRPAVLQLRLDPRWVSPDFPPA